MEYVAGKLGVYERFLGLIDSEQSPILPNSITIGHACYVVGNSVVFILGVFSLILRWE